MTNALTKAGFWFWYLDPSGAETRIDIIRWWEKRRWAFNVCVGIVGIFTWFAVLIAGSASVKPGADLRAICNDSWTTPLCRNGKYLFHGGLDL
jgi:hypothetical protein